MAGISYSSVVHNTDRDLISQRLIDLAVIRRVVVRVEVAFDQQQTKQEERTADDR